MLSVYLHCTEFNHDHTMTTGHVGVDGTLKHLRVKELTQAAGYEFCLTADGHELESLKEQFIGVPFSTKARVQEWRGDIAYFMATHLC